MSTDPSSSDRDVISVLLDQHTRIKELFKQVHKNTGTQRQHSFDELRTLLAAHETGEEMVLRPVTRTDAERPQVADARNHEEDEANHVLAELERMDVASTDFERTFAEFETAVLQHAEREEREEFPSIQKVTSDDKRRAMGRALLAAEKVAPSHPHPSTAGSTVGQWTVGPFASLVDKARDAIRSATSRD